MLAFAYTFAQKNANKKATLFFFTIPAKYLPYGMLLLTLVMNGPSALLQQGSGLLAAHLYDFLTRIWPAFGGGINYIQTPQFVHDAFGVQQQRSRGYGTAYMGTATGASTASTSDSRGWSSALGTSSTWRSRGPGRRLGSD